VWPEECQGSGALLQQRAAGWEEWAFGNSCWHSSISITLLTVGDEMLLPGFPVVDRVQGELQAA
jgi:hypothetical protein